LIGGNYLVIRFIRFAIIEEQGCAFFDCERLCNFKFIEMTKFGDAATKQKMMLDGNDTAIDEEEESDWESFSDSESDSDAEIVQGECRTCGRERIPIIGGDWRSEFCDNDYALGFICSTVTVNTQRRKSGGGVRGMRAIESEI
jgi:hypothetical protein